MFLPLLIMTACTEVPLVSLPPELGEQIPVVPGEGLPSELVLQASNNNLDVVEHEGAFFFAFRTAPSHFASDQTRLYVLRSTDQQTWTFEAEFFQGTDLREPRLLSWEGRVFLYYAVLGDDPNAFEPQGSKVSVRSADGSWSEPADIFDADFIPWRVRVVGQRPVLIGYTGGGEIYDVDGYPQLDIQLLTSLRTGGGSETDFVFLESEDQGEGDLVAVSRNEAGDAQGFGSHICRAPAADLTDWTCSADPRKYDSPLLFRSQGRVWLIARRHVTETGHFDLANEELSFEQKSLAYQTAYWVEPKRCALWQVDPQALVVDFVLDLPSRGDTCFPSALEGEPGHWMVYNYSNDPQGPDLSWVEGQHGETGIWRQELVIPASE